MKAVDFPESNYKLSVQELKLLDGDQLAAEDKTQRWVW